MDSPNNNGRRHLRHNNNHQTKGAVSNNRLHLTPVPPLLLSYSGKIKRIIICQIFFYQRVEKHAERFSVPTKSYKQMEAEGMLDGLKMGRVVGDL